MRNLWMGLLALVMAMGLAGCMATVGVQPDAEVSVTAPSAEVEVEEVEDVAVMYDDPVQGWYIEGHLLNGIWIAPFWTTDIVVLNGHWGWYHGHHRDHLDRHFNRYGGHGNYNHDKYRGDHRRYQEHRQNRRDNRQEHRQDRKDVRQEHRQDRKDVRQDGRQRQEQRQEHRQQPQMKQNHPAPQRQAPSPRREIPQGGGGGRRK